MTATVEAPDTYLVADLFCGAGGSSTGARMAIEEIGGEMELVAVNHWNTAIATHSANHPTARHIVEDVSIVDPEDVVEGGKAGHPDGESRVPLPLPGEGRETHPRPGPHEPLGRSQLADQAGRQDRAGGERAGVRQMGAAAPRRPARPAPDRGEHFQAWFLTFQSLGYQAEWRMLNAADYGDATTRVRFFLIARRDGRPIAWPEPTHARGDTGMFPGRLSLEGGTGNNRLEQPRQVPAGPSEVHQEAPEPEHPRPYSPGAGTLRRTTGAPLHPAPRPAPRGRRRPPSKQADGGEE